MNDDFKNIEIIDKVSDVHDIISLIEKHPFAFIFATLGLGIGILIDNERNKNKEMK